jgi:hypothetical protein
MAFSRAFDLVGEDIPEPSEYLRSKQKDGKPLGADALFKETWCWLRDRGCEKFVNPSINRSLCSGFYPVYPVRGSHQHLRPFGKAPYHRRSNSKPLCTDEPVVSETG